MHFSPSGNFSIEESKFFLAALRGKTNWRHHHNTCDSIFSGRFFVVLPGPDSRRIHSIMIHNVISYIKYFYCIFPPIVIMRGRENQHWACNLLLAFFFLSFFFSVFCSLSQNQFDLYNYTKTKADLIFNTHDVSSINKLQSQFGA